MAEQASEAGRALQALRQRGPKVCRICGKSTAGTKRRWYCSDACKSKAWRQRKARRLDPPDFLDSVIAESTAADPEFPAKLEAARERRGQAQ